MMEEIFIWFFGGSKRNPQIVEIALFLSPFSIERPRKFNSSENPRKIFRKFRKTLKFHQDTVQFPGLSNKFEIPQPTLLLLLNFLFTKIFIHFYSGYLIFNQANKVFEKPLNFNGVLFLRIAGFLYKKKKDIIRRAEVAFSRFELKNFKNFGPL